MVSHHPDIKTSAADFCSAFKSSCESLTTTLDLTPTPEQRQSALEQISELSKRLTAATVFLPAYDQRQCAALLKGVQAKAASGTAPRAKFTFGARKGRVGGGVGVNTAGAVDGAAAQTASRAGSSVVETTSPKDPVASAPGHETDVTSLKSLAITGKQAEYIRPATSTQDDAKDYKLSNLTHCVVSILGTPIAALHATHLQHCLVITGPISGSLFIQDCVGCVFVVACRQFRMHATTRTDIYLHINSHPIIEDCSGLRFATYPTTFVTSLPSNTTNPTVPLSKLYALAQISPDPATNQYREVEDFKWLKRGHSPNWRLMADGEGIKDGVEWEALLTHPGGALDVDDGVLGKWLPAPSS
ncbi:tubulin binding cofactor C-domain-containing protein [Fimicolochytrium jonesii]|uniref:tubulin binding cofactor C-domain-containing protein n=1 Tax=Fimicolochytrium jonesii TaxID=1396493 RepID=UPI0022FEB968|nr:tubulin binding cofactor C-domain-containing protein [Fimicolochytrium jonesii]KAI8820987.1 tubulin binding cofactor C-domain-containing protein [Fimicolochytrium jonesii]